MTAPMSIIDVKADGTTVREDFDGERWTTKMTRPDRTMAIHCCRDRDEAYVAVCMATNYPLPGTLMPRGMPAGGPKCRGEPLLANTVASAIEKARHERGLAVRKSCQRLARHWTDIAFAGAAIFLALAIIIVLAAAYGEW